ncbi:MAG: hypothetical protein ACOC2E_01705 [Bacteroidota bacterium]
MQAEITTINKLSEKDINEAYLLFSRFYSNVDFDNFLKDLSEKDWMIRLISNGQLAGFSTQQLMELEIDIKNTHFLFSGDTIVDPEYWSRNQLGGAFIHLFLHVLNKYKTPLYWFLITKGFRTYRFLPVFFKRFYPSISNNNKDLKVILDTVAKHKFGDEYNCKTELVTYKTDKDRFDSIYAEIPASRKKDRNVSYFIKRNPEYAKGVELACIAELSRESLTAPGIRLLESAKPEWNV